MEVGGFGFSIYVHIKMVIFLQGNDSMLGYINKEII